ncbi:hypothetical protein ES703_27689 [subsurface metagenome]
MKSKRIQIEEKFGVSAKRILESLYSRNCYSYRSIADFLGADSKSVREWAGKAGIESRSRSEAEACRFKKKIPLELLLRQLIGHLSLCICPRCQTQKYCSKGKEWHEKGYCVMTCADLKLK